MAIMAGVFQVARDYLLVVWPRVERMLSRDRTPLDLDRLRQRCHLGEITLWLAVEVEAESARCLACFTTCLVSNAKGQTLIVHLMAGRQIERWIESALTMVGALARRVTSIGEIHVYSRKGWKPYAQKFASLASELNIPFTIGRDRPTRRGHPRANRIDPEIGVAHHVARQ